MTWLGAIKYPCIFAVAFAITYLLVPLVSACATYFGVVDRPDERRLNRMAIPRAGGIAVFIGFHAACAAIFLYPWPLPFGGSLDFVWWISFLGASAFLLFVGLLDDIFSLGWFAKLLGQITAAVLLFRLDISVDSILGYDLSPEASLLLTVLWCVAFVNAFNLIDGMDGLASGLAAIAAVGLAGNALFANEPSDVLVMFALLGASLAFLRYNFNPASIFLGDSGSMFLGFTLAAFALTTSNKSTTVATIGVPLLAIGVPLFDTVLAIWRRSVRAVLASSQTGRKGGILHADMEHIHHRLLRAGLSQRKAALMLFGLNIALVVVGLLALIYNSKAGGIYIVAFVLGTYVVVRHLARVELWDSGTAILQGLRRPTRPLLIAFFFPIFDAVALCLALLLSLAAAYPTLPLAELKQISLYSIPIWCGLPFIALLFVGTYSRVWHLASMLDFFLLFASLGAAEFLNVGVSLMVGYRPSDGRPLLQALLHFGFAAALIAGIRILPRAVQEIVTIFDEPSALHRPGSWNILIYGAGFRGILYLKRRGMTSFSGGNKGRVVGFIDDDLHLRGRRVHNYPVLGNFADLPQIIKKARVNEIVVSVSLSETQKTKLVELCSNNQIQYKEWSFGENLVAGSVKDKSVIGY